MIERKHGHSAEEFPVSAYLGSSKDLNFLSSGKACKLVLPPTIRVANSTFNTSQLRKHASAPPQPPPAFFDAQGPRSYSVRWLGFGAADDTWETEASVLSQNGGRCVVQTRQLWSGNEHGFTKLVNPLR